MTKCPLTRAAGVFALALATHLAQAQAPAAASAAAPALPADPAIAAAAKLPGAVLTESGMVYRVLLEGQGASPTATDLVKVHYRGTLLNGKEFDSSYKRNAPASLPLNRVIKCWTEGVQKMRVGGKAQLTCPSSLAYGERAMGNDIPAHSTLVFEVELLGIGGG